MRHHGAVRIAAVILGASVAISLASCTSGRETGSISDQPASPSSADLTAVGDGVRCDPTPLTTTDAGVPEAHGTGGDAGAWALLWSAPPWSPNQQVKVVWRMQGDGAFDVVAIGPSDEIVRPSTGPTPHGASNWDRPGDEWGSSFALPHDGCWRLEASRGGLTSRVFVTVTT